MRRAIAIVAAVVVVIAAALVTAVLVGGGEGDSGPDSAAPTTTVPEVDNNFMAAVWPYEATATRYTDPVAAARGFAEVFIGFVNPEVGTFLAGDGRSGEVEVRAARSPVTTTVFVRQIGEAGTWWVLGSDTPNIEVDRPGERATVESPLALAGRASAFEGTVNVRLTQDGSTAPIGTSFVTGSGSAQLGPFSGEVSFTLPTVGSGALVLFTSSAEDGRVIEAETLRIGFRSSSPQRSCQPDPAPAAGPSEMEVRVFFSCSTGGSEELVAVTRVVPASPGVLRRSLEALLAGPTPTERASGLSSFFTEATEDALLDVALSADGRATVDLADLRPIIPNASTSAGSGALLRELDATVFQFSTVGSVRYQIRGSCETFFEWLQRSCEIRTG